jgi:hypothetical protein
VSVLQQVLLVGVANTQWSAGRLSL